MKVGLSLREVKVYTKLRLGGELTASQVAKKTDLIRTNAYDVLNSLLKKGVVAYVIRSGTKYFRAADPEKLLDYIDTREKDLKELKGKVEGILPELKPIVVNGDRPLIEVYEGKEGLKTILEMSVRESLRTKKEIIGISVQQQKCRDLATHYHERWYGEREKNKIKSRYLMSIEEPLIPVKYTKFKVLPKEAKNPNEIFIFGNVTCQFFFVGDFFTAIVIKNKEITDKYRDYFNFLWKLVK